MSDKKDVNGITVLIDPNKHVGLQLKKARERKGFSVREAFNAYNQLAPVKRRITTTVAYYNKENRSDIGLSEICLMLAAIGIKNLIIDDYVPNLG